MALQVGSPLWGIVGHRLLISLLLDHSARTFLVAKSLFIQAWIHSFFSFQCVGGFYSSDLSLKGLHNLEPTYFKTDSDNLFFIKDGTKDKGSLQNTVGYMLKYSYLKHF